MNQKRSSPGADSTEARKVSSAGAERDLPNPTPSLKPVDLAEAKIAIELALAALPHLTVHGIGAYDARRVVFSGHAFDACRTDFGIERVATAIAFFRSGPRTRKRREDSGWLKHLAERWGRDQGMSSYVANGELIAAAVYLGLPIQGVSKAPNVLIRVGRLP
jgi:hypothetical protein